MIELVPAVFNVVLLCGGSLSCAAAAAAAAAATALLLFVFQVHIKGGVGRRDGVPRLNPPRLGGIFACDGLIWFE